MKKVIVIGISGITNGGKTTLCERLEKDLPMATHINMDDYFFSADSGRIPFVEELNHGNYEDVRAIDFERMVVDVDRWVTDAADKPIDGHPQILFLEGILIFNYPPLVKYYSRKYFLTLTKEQCWERRKHRSYDPPDPPNYFDVIVWPMYLQNRASIRDQKDIVFLDGMESTDTTYRRIHADIKTLMEE